MRNKTLLILIVILALFLRVSAISKYPTGLTQDEASFGYDAYSLLLTGKDQWGKSWPLTFRSFGDFKLPLYSYLAIPAVKSFGLNEFSTRLPNAVFGSLAVLVTFFMVKEVFARKKGTFNPETLGLVSSSLLAISPWHVSLSRGAFEANLTTFFVPLGVWAFLKGKEKPFYMIISAFSFGINLFSYHSARFFTPLLVLVLALFVYSQGTLVERIKTFFSKEKVFIAVFSFFLGVALATMFLGAGKRGADILITNPTDRWQAVSDRRYEAVLSGLPDSLARIFSNKLTYVTREFTRNYFSYISPTFLFFSGAGEWTYGMIPGRGVLYLIEMLFTVLALIFLIRKKDVRALSFFLVWVLASPLPAAVTKGPYAPNRAAVMLPAILVISAYGLLVFYSLIKNKFSNLISLGLISLLLILSFAFFVEEYLYRAPRQGAEGMRYGMRETFEYVRSIEKDYSEIMVSRSLSVPQIWVAFFSEWSPEEFQEASKGWLVYESQGIRYLDQFEGYRLGKYIFGSLNTQNLIDKKGMLLVGKPGDFHGHPTTKKVIYYPDGRAAVWIVESDSLSLAISFSPKLQN